MPSSGSAAESPAIEGPPAIESLLKQEVYTRVVRDREALTYAKLDGDPPAQIYSFYAAMLVRASVGLTRRVLMDYQLYSKMISYVDRAVYDETRKSLRIEGGIWKFKINSTLQFEEYGDRWVHFRIVAGHFKGLTGDVYFESRGEAGTLVYMRGSQVGSNWPPRFVIERGAEIVFGFTARRMRSYIESQKLVLEGRPTAAPPSPPPGESGAKPNQGITPGNDHGTEVPKPRSRL